MTMEMPIDSAPETAEREENRKRGFTLTEIAIVLGIIGLILGAIWVAAAAVYTNMRVARSAQELLQITQSVRSLYSTSTTTGITTDGTTGIMTTNLIPAGVFPTDSLPSGATSTTVNAPWSGGNINVYSDSVNVAGTGDAFTVQFEVIPPQGCINLLVSGTGSGRDPGMVGAGATASSTAGTSIGVTAAAGGGPSSSATGQGWQNLTSPTANVSAVNASKWCGTTTATVAFKFRLRV